MEINYEFDNTDNKSEKTIAELDKMLYYDFVGKTKSPCGKQVGDYARGKLNVAYNDGEVEFTEKKVLEMAEIVAEQVIRNPNLMSQEVVMLTVLDGAERWAGLVKESIDNRVLPKEVLVREKFAAIGKERNPDKKPSITIDTISVKSYTGTKSNGNPEILIKPKHIIPESKVIIVEDIVDTGITINFIKEYLVSLGVKEENIKVCAMLERKSKRDGNPERRADFLGATIYGDEFVLGTGLDYRQKGRDLAGIRRVVNRSEHLDNSCRKNYFESLLLSILERLVGKIL